MSLISFKKRKAQSFLLIHTDSLVGWWQGEWWLAQVVQSLVKFFQWLNQGSQVQFRLVVAAGMGLGLGWSVTVFSQPTMIQANLPVAEVNQSSHSDQPVIAVKKIRLPGKKISTPVLWDEASAGLEEPGMIKIAVDGDHPMADDVRLVTTGERIEIIGSNNGIYGYRVIEVRTVPLTEAKTVIESWLSQNTSVLILSTSEAWWSNQQIMIVARPIQ